MSNPDVIVVGAGVFGSTIARHLAGLFHHVVVFDDRRECSGTSASGGLIKPSWLKSFGKAKLDRGLELLHEIYGLEELQFEVWPTRVRTKVWRVPTVRVLEGLETRSEPVEAVFPNDGGGPRVQFGGINVLHARKAVIVAAGAWSDQLVELDGLQIKVGVSYRWPSHRLGKNVIRPWAPYKQVVAFDATEGGVWAGDGTAILRHNWDYRVRTMQAMARLTSHLDLPEDQNEEFVGYRPFLKGLPHVVQRGKGLWVATGGGKNGTVSAALAALRLGELLS